MSKVETEETSLRQGIKLLLNLEVAQGQPVIGYGTATLTAKTTLTTQGTKNTETDTATHSFTIVGVEKKF